MTREEMITEAVKMTIPPAIMFCLYAKHPQNVPYWAADWAPYIRANFAQIATLVPDANLKAA